MSGHSKWSRIKHKKETTDKKRGALFSKLLSAVSIAARGNPDPGNNPRLRAAIDKAKNNNVPQANIERALQRSSEQKALHEVVIEAYGPEKVAFVVDCITDNKNRTLAEIKQILLQHNAKFADAGSVLWSFESKPEGQRVPQFTQNVSFETEKKITSLLYALEEHPDVQCVVTNIAATSQ